VPAIGKEGVGGVSWGSLESRSIKSISLSTAHDQNGAPCLGVSKNWTGEQVEMNSCLRAELTKSDIAVAEGIRVKPESPVLALCRKLFAAGYDPATPLEAYRGDTLALRVKSIGHAAQMQVNGNTRLVFAVASKRRMALPMRSFSEAAE